MKYESIAAQVLEQLGADVKHLPESSKKEADLLAVLDGCKLLIEEKLKHPGDVKMQNAVLAEDESDTTSVPIIRDNTLSGIARNAARQLQSSGIDKTHDLRVIWFTAVGSDAEAKYNQFIATLYGETRIVAINLPGLKKCYFFGESDFFRFKDQLDGAIVAYLSENNTKITIKLCLNPLAKNWKLLRDSPFAKELSSGLIDPIDEEENGLSFIADGDIDRNNETVVIEYLREKYNLKNPMKMDMNMITTTIRMPK